MKKINKKELTKTAAALGKNAFSKNLKCVPVLDIELMSFIAKERSVLGTKIGSSNFILKAWLKGWHDANINYLKVG